MHKRVVSTGVSPAGWDADGDGEECACLQGPRHSNIRNIRDKSPRSEDMSVTVLLAAGDEEIATDFWVLAVVSRYDARVLISECEKWVPRLDACERVSLVGAASLAYERLFPGI
jgi:hypothetical protein